MPTSQSNSVLETWTHSDLALPTRVLGTPNLGAALRAGIGQLWWGGSLRMAGDRRGVQLLPPNRETRQELKFSGRFVEFWSGSSSIW
jgi:hypothetical protein